MSLLISIRYVVAEQQHSSSRLAVFPQVRSPSREFLVGHKVSSCWDVTELPPKIDFMEELLQMPEPQHDLAAAPLQASYFIFKAAHGHPTEEALSAACVQDLYLSWSISHDHIWSDDRRSSTNRSSHFGSFVSSPWQRQTHLEFIKNNQAGWSFIDRVIWWVQKQHICHFSFSNPSVWNTTINIQVWRKHTSVTHCARIPNFILRFCDTPFCSLRVFLHWDSFVTS